MNYAVRAANVDLLFVYLVTEYRQQPTSAKALALYRLFCAPRAPALLSVSEILPPRDPQLSSQIAPIEIAATSGQAAGVLRVPRLVPKFLFDNVVEGLSGKCKRLRKAKRDYRVRKTPAENLPFEKLTEFQRYFSEHVWKPILKPALVAAGFWRLSSSG